MKHRFWTMMLTLALLLSLTGSAFAAAPYETVSSPEEMAAALAPRAGLLSLRTSAAPVRVLLLGGAPEDFCGAERVIRWEARDLFVLEFGAAEAAEAAVERFGADRAWLDTPETGARVLEPGDGANETDPEATPEPTAQPTETAEPTAQPGYTARSWGAAAMGLDAFRSDEQIGAHLRGRRAIVAVLDTGADMTVPQLQERSISPESYDFVHDSPDLTDITSGLAAGHGTTVATLLCDLLPEEAELMLLRVFDDTGSASRTMILTALEYALEHGADVVNMSLGWEGADESYTFLNAELDHLADNGVTVICAAGNRGTDAKTCYPASYKTTISVSAVNKTLNFESFSNYGGTVDFAAPGSGIRTITLGGREKLERGTSFAAPHITALAADMLLCRNLTVDELYDTIRSHCEDLGYAGRDEQYGWGFPRLGDYAAESIVHEWDGGRIDPLAKKDADGTRTFTCTVCGQTREEPVPATKGEKASPFRDVSESAFYAEGVTWAVANAITTGTSKEGPLFSPDAVCTRAQTVTFLWRAAGCPEPETADSPFEDVQDENAFYYRAVLWAVEKGLTTGVTPTVFAPDETVTRAQTVTFLWRLAGKPAEQAENPFADVTSDWFYYTPVLWAVGQSITNGVDETHFAPGSPCTRGQIVTFLYRDLG